MACWAWLRSGLTCGTRASTGSSEMVVGRKHPSKPPSSLDLFDVEGDRERNLDGNVDPELSFEGALADGALASERWCGRQAVACAWRRS